MTSGQQRFERCLRASSYALLGTGLAALLVSEAVSLAGGILCVILLGLSWRFETDWPKRHPALVFILLGGWFLVDWLLVSSAVEASLHLLLAISLIKLFGRKQDKDYGMLYAVSFLFLLIASVYTLSVLFLAVLIAYVFLGILSFILFESRQAFRRNPESSFQLSGYLRVSLLMALLVALVAAPIFVAIPRTNWGLFRVSDLQNGNLSGFSDRVMLGDIGRIIQNRELFMRVRLDRPASALPSHLKWRGVALNHYDGLAWSNTDRDYQPLPIDSFRNSFVVEPELLREGRPLRQRVTLEPGSDVVFTLGKVVQIGSVQRGMGGLILRDQNDSLRFYRTPSASLQYTVSSDIVSRAEQLSKLSQGPIPTRLSGRFLQLPRLDPRIPKLADSITQKAPDALNQALRLEAHLRSSFGYSLENAPAASGDPLAAFLFEYREGHCEFFATAMAVMLRTQGIPSRIVNGFRLGEFNDWSGYWVIRQSDAHSWVEAYFPGAGWLEFDPTPAGGQGPQPLLTKWLAQMLDSVDLFWTDVITFDRLKQLTFFLRAREQLRDGMRRLAAGLTRFNPAESIAGIVDFKASLGGLGWRVLAASIAALTGMALVFFFRLRLIRWWRRWRGTPGSGSPAPSYYLEFLDLLGRKGFSRSFSETPHEFAARVAAGSPLPSQITDLYYRHRFGQQPPPAAELRSLRRLIRAWVKGMRGADKVKASGGRRGEANDVP